LTDVDRAASYLQIEEPDFAPRRRMNRKIATAATSETMNAIQLKQAHGPTHAATP